MAELALALAYIRFTLCWRFLLNGKPSRGNNKCRQLARYHFFPSPSLLVSEQSQKAYLLHGFLKCVDSPLLEGFLILPNMEGV